LLEKQKSNYVQELTDEVSNRNSRVMQLEADNFFMFGDLQEKCVDCGRGIKGRSINQVGERVKRQAIDVRMRRNAKIGNANISGGQRCKYSEDFNGGRTQQTQCCYGQ
jgi:hypothetical protein